MCEVKASSAWRATMCIMCCWPASTARPGKEAGHLGHLGASESGSCKHCLARRGDSSGSAPGQVGLHELHFKMTSQHSQHGRTKMRRRSKCSDAAEEQLQSNARPHAPRTKLLLCLLLSAQSRDPSQLGTTFAAPLKDRQGPFRSGGSSCQVFRAHRPAACAMSWHGHGLGNTDNATTQPDRRSCKPAEASRARKEHTNPQEMTKNIKHS